MKKMIALASVLALVVSFEASAKKKHHGNKKAAQACKAEGVSKKDKTAWKECLGRHATDM